MGEVVITGIGMVTPLGRGPGAILSAIRRGERAAAPSGWPKGGFACPVRAEVKDFDPEAFVTETKTVRLMNRDALLAAGAARLAMRDAGIEIGADYPPEEVGLFGATGLAGIELSEVSRLVQLAAGEDGGLDLHRFGEVALKQVRPVLSFKILSNMPLCFVSIFERIQGPNSIYNPWEGQGAHAIAEAIRAVGRGDAGCALAGGCDVKTHALAFLALARLGVFGSWEREGSGCIPGEGAAFIVLENAEVAAARGARVYARIRRSARRTAAADEDRPRAYGAILDELNASPAAIVRAADGDQRLAGAESEALAARGVDAVAAIRPKENLGNVFAAAAAVQVGLAAAWAGELGPGASVLANCFGYGSEQAAFVLEAP